MPWLRHPKFVPVRDRILHQLRSKEYSFRKVKNVAFLCGGQDSPIRDRVAEYLRKKADLQVFYADDAWEVIASKETLNALKMEEELGELADIVVVVVESPGTFAELGAFAISPTLRRKMLPILDRSHENALSFINSGPVSWINGDSLFKPVIWSDFGAVLSAAKDIDDRIARLPGPSAARIPDLAASPKHLLFLVCDLVAVFGPLTVDHLTFYVEALVGDPTTSVETLVGLAHALQLISKSEQKGRRYYSRPPEDGRLRAFQRKQYLDLPALRAEVLSVLEGIPVSRSVLESTHP